MKPFSIMEKNLKQEVKLMFPEPNYPHSSLYDSNAMTDLTNFLYGDLFPLCYEKVLSFEVTYAKTDEPVPFLDRLSLSYSPLQIGEAWSNQNFDCAWMHLKATLPPHCQLENLDLDFDDGGEALLVDSQGSAIKGFSFGSDCFGGYNYPCWSKRHYPLKEFIHDGKIDLWLDCASNATQGDFIGKGMLRRADLVREKPATLNNFFDFYVFLDYLRCLSYSDPHFKPVQERLQQVAALYRYRDPEADSKAAAIFQEIYALPGKTDPTSFRCVGYAHLDLLWLWPERETRRKARRTLANQIYLAEKYPSYTFALSQPQELEFVHEDDPELYQKVVALLKSGAFEAVGGSWVENDTNISGEESLVRQELYGQKYWQELLGHYVEMKWLPDSFGYSAALPQILRLSEQKYILANKITWCLFTDFPYHTFEWKGLDGSSILAHVQLDHDYNSKATYSNLYVAKSHLSPEEGKPEGILAYGIGDGGGGPGDYHVQALSRQAKVPYFPKIQFGTAEGFFHDIDGQKLPVYQGELYLEQHRGTNTSQSQNKQHNRHFEEKMKALEYLYSVSNDQEEKTSFDALWKEAMLYQFHDCLPGTSIQRVYNETDIAYARMQNELECLANKHGYSFLPTSGSKAINHLNESVRRFVHGKEGYFLLSGKAGECMTPKQEQKIRDISLDTIETDDLIISMNTLDGSFGKIVSRKSGKSLLEHANRLRVYIDKGDAWNIPWDFRNQPEQYLTLIKQKQAEYEDFFEIQNTYQYLQSELQETIIIDKHRPYIEFQHDLNWKNIERMLRAEFKPTEYSPVSHAEIQFGYLDRSTLDDTEHHRAQYECASQKYVDVSSSTQGICLMNCSKGGFSAKDGMISLDLLRSTNYPCVNGDLKPTQYVYALYPHDGGFDPKQDANLAMGLNACFLYGKGFAVPTTDSDQIEISCFKPAYDKNGYILHMYEKTGEEGSVLLRLPAGMKIIEEDNLLEDPLGPAPTNEITFKPFQIRCFRVC